MGYVCVGIAILVVVAAIIAAINHQNALAAALAAYRNCLERLKADPNNPELRQEALQLGRAYSNLTRNKEGITVYDEVALKNDIDAACAGSVNLHNRSLEERLEKLQRLYSTGPAPSSAHSG